MNILALLLVALMPIDTTLTISVLTDFQKRVTAIDKAFQMHMTDIVNQIFTVQNEFYQKAVKKIAGSYVRKSSRNYSKNTIIQFGYCSADIQHGTTTKLEHVKMWPGQLLN